MLASLGTVLGALGAVWETFLSSWRYFEVLREGFRGFQSYFTGFKSFPQCFYRFPSMLQFFLGFTCVFAAMASEVSLVGERSEPRWRAKRAPVASEASFVWLATTRSLSVALAATCLGCSTDSHSMVHMPSCSVPFSTTVVPLLCTCLQAHAESLSIMHVSIIFCSFFHLVGH